MTRAVSQVKPIHTDEWVFPLSVEQYHDMIRAGVVTDDDPVELIEGVLVFHMPKNPPHRFVTRAAFDAISAMLPTGWHCQSQDPITLNDSEPEPDVAIVRGQTTDYRARHPGPADIGVVIEVADATLDRDRGTKLRSYARAGIKHYWIINLVDQQIEVFGDPDTSVQPPDYRDRTVFSAEQEAAVVLDGVPIGKLKLAALLP